MIGEDPPGAGMGRVPALPFLLSPPGGAMGTIGQWHEERTKIPAGRYLLRCVKAGKEKIWHQGRGGWGKSEKMVLWFEVFEGEYAGSILPAFLPLSGDKISQGSKYFQFWVVANGLRRPLRNRLKEMPPSKFVGKVFDGEVVDVKPKWHKGVEQPALFHYSRVDALYEVAVGDPNS